MAQNMNDDNVISAVTLMERIVPRLSANSRETISRQRLSQISSSLQIVLELLTAQECREPLILTPIMEVITLIDGVMEEQAFVETDNDTKEIIVNKVMTALQHLYMFAGVYYMTHEFTYTMSKTDVLRNIVDACVANGFYFGVDKQLREEGIL